MQFPLMLQKPWCQTFGSGWGVPQLQIKTAPKKKGKAKKKKKKKEHRKKRDRRRKRSLLSSTRCHCNANFFFSFSPPELNQKNTGTTAIKKLTRRQGEQWLCRLKKKERAKRKLAPGRPFTAEQSVQNTQTTRFMQETEGISGYYVVDCDV